MSMHKNTTDQMNKQYGSVDWEKEAAHLSGDLMSAATTSSPPLDGAGETRRQMVKPSEKKIPVMEFFGPTIQGEGSVAGMQTYFLRTGGCDYRCKRCDSMHAVLPELIKQSATMMTQTQIFDMISSATRLTDAITISGGNPAMWDLEDLVFNLVSSGWKVYLETQGTIWRPWMRMCDITVSPKGPGMGEKFELDKFTKFITAAMQAETYPTLKVVVFQQGDIELMADILQQFPYLQRKAYFSIGNVNPPAPAERNLDGDQEQSHDDFVLTTLSNYKQIAEEVLGDPRPNVRNVRILPQIHTLLWANAKGK